MNSRPSMVVSPASTVSGEVRVPGDKSIAHRALMLGGLGTGTTRLQGVPSGQDVLSTLACLRAMGVHIKVDREEIIIDGASDTLARGVSGSLDCCNSGTTMRLLMGLCAPFANDLRLIGDASLSRRPMERAATPLRAMGAAVTTSPNGCPPVVLRRPAAAAMQSISYELPIASAQIKSAVMLAALSASGETTITDRIHSRDHTERLFPAFGLACRVSDHEIIVPGGQTPRGTSLRIPGDLSSAAPWLVAAAGTPGSSVTIHDVGLNPTRMGLVRVMERMGARITITIKETNPEPIGSIHIVGTPLTACDVQADEIAALVDEVPLLAVLACRAKGISRIRGVGELRVKESDRLKVLTDNLSALGVHITIAGPNHDTLEISGPQTFQSATIDPQGDHRMAMAFAVAALWANANTTILNPNCVDISYPDFWDTLRRITLT